MKRISPDKKSDTELEVNELKRTFIKKFGIYAASAPLGAFLLMSPSSSYAVNSNNNGNHTGQNKPKKN